MTQVLRIDWELLWDPARWAGVFSVVALIMVFNVIGFGLHGPQANQWNVLFSLINNPFVAMILLPMLFLILILDLAWRDMHTWQASIWVRIPSRLSWWIAKMIILAGAASAYVAGIFSLGIIIGVLVAPFHNGWSRLSFRPGSFTQTLAGHGLSPETALVWNCVLLWGALVGFGVIGMSLSLWGRGIAGAGAIMAASTFAAYGLWVVHPSWGIWFPSFQGVLSAHAGLDPRLPRYFRVVWSLQWDGLLILISAITGAWRMATAML